MESRTSKSNTEGFGQRVRQYYSLGYTSSAADSFVRGAYAAQSHVILLHQSLEKLRLGRKRKVTLNVNKINKIDKKGDTKR